jgi:hypothetical protein
MLATARRYMGIRPNCSKVAGFWLAMERGPFAMGPLDTEESGIVPEMGRCSRTGWPVRRRGATNDRLRWSYLTGTPVDAVREDSCAGMAGVPKMCQLK